MEPPDDDFDTPEEDLELPEEVLELPEEVLELPELEAARQVNTDVIIPEHTRLGRGARARRCASVSWLPIQQRRFRNA